MLSIHFDMLHCGSFLEEIQFTTLDIYIHFLAHMFPFKMRLDYLQ